MTVRDLFTKGATAPWRKYDTLNVPASGVHEPDKDEIDSAAVGIDTLLDTLDSRIEAIEATTFGVVKEVFSTVADMEAATEYSSGDPIANGDLVLVIDDPAGDVEDGNGYYLRTAGAWVWERSFSSFLERVIAAVDTSMPIAQLLTRASSAVGTVAATTDVSPTQYFVKRHPTAAIWTPPTENDV